MMRVVLRGDLYSKRKTNFWIPILLLGVAACGDSGPQPTVSPPPAPSYEQTSEQAGEDTAKDFATAMGAGTGGGYRVVISGSVDRPSVSILKDSVQWLPARYPNQPIEITGSQVVYPVDTYRNNRDDQTVEASFEIECPPA